MSNDHKGLNYSHLSIPERILSSPLKPPFKTKGPGLAPAPFCCISRSAPDRAGTITRILHFNPDHVIRGHPYTRFRTHADAGVRLHYQQFCNATAETGVGGLPDGTHGLRQERIPSPPGATPSSAQSLIPSGMPRHFRRWQTSISARLK